MRSDDAPTPRLAAGLLVSLLFHAGLAALVVGSSPAGRALLDRIDVDPDAPELAKPPRVTVGEPESTTTSITWIGYDEYEEHLARLAETEQAAETLQAPTPPRPEPSPLAQQETPPAPEPARPAPPAQQTPEQIAASARRLAAAVQSAQEQAMHGIDALADAARGLTTPLAAALEPIEGPPAPDPSPQNDNADDPTKPDQLARDPAADTSAEPQPAKPADQPAVAQAPPAPQSPPTPRPDPRRPSDREAIATAIKHAHVIRPGKPLAAEGLRISTVAPDVHDVTEYLSRSRRDQVVRAFFGADGKVKDAIILQSSGYKAIDQAGLNAIYNWRAEGPPLKSLKPDDRGATIPIDFRIVL